MNKKDNAKVSVEIMNKILEILHKNEVDSFVVKFKLNGATSKATYPVRGPK